jgi:hypothetical protein
MERYGPFSECVESVLNQEYETLEVVFVFDGIRRYTNVYRLISERKRTWLFIPTTKTAESRSAGQNRRTSLWRDRGVYIR